jgi:hypothetical protein
MRPHFAFTKKHFTTEGTEDTENVNLHTSD